MASAHTRGRTVHIRHDNHEGGCRSLGDRCSVDNHEGGCRSLEDRCSANSNRRPVTQHHEVAWLRHECHRRPPMSRETQPSVEVRSLASSSGPPGDCRLTGAGHKEKAHNSRGLATLGLGPGTLRGLWKSTTDPYMGIFKIAPRVRHRLHSTPS